MIQEDADRVFIGAAATHRSVLESRLIRQRFPVLTQALETLGSPHIRNTGTIGGNVVTASPAGETLPPLYALNAWIELQGGSGRRTIPVRKFILGPGKVDLHPGEVMTGVGIPLKPAYRIHHFEKVGLRNGLAVAVASLAALVDLSDGGKVARARFAWGSVGPTVAVSEEIDAFLEGKPMDGDHVSEILPLVEGCLSPIDDVRATAAYRRAVAGNLLYRLCENGDRP